MLISLFVAELEAARWDAIGFVSCYTAIRRNGEYDTGAHGKGEHKSTSGTERMPRKCTVMIGTRAAYLRCGISSGFVARLSKWVDLYALTEHLRDLDSLIQDC